MLFYIHEFCQTKDQRKQQHVQAANCLGKFFGTLPPRSPGPPLQTMCAHLSAKTPASLDLQISPEIEESAGREILKQSGASFFPSPDLTCPIWRFFSRLSNLFLQICPIWGFSSDLHICFCVFVPKICDLPRRSLLHTLFN